MNQHLINFISQKFTLSDRDIELCNEYFEPVLFPKNRIVEEEGKIPHYLYFVVSGFMRLFYYNDNGDEITSHIN